MSSAITSNSSMPSIGNTLTTNAVAKANAASGASSSSNSPYSASNIGSTFLNLLVKELQNQDPTAPMDSTAMVGQMISLNQLDQLIGINQAVGTSSGSSSASSGSNKSATQQSISAALSALTSPTASPIASGAASTLTNPYLSMSQAVTNGPQGDLAQQQSLSAFPTR